MNKVIYWSALAVVVFSVLGAGLTDLLLYLNQKPTITDYLRAEPTAFWGPVGLTLLFLVGLTAHLYLRCFPWN